MLVLVSDDHIRGDSIGYFKMTLGSGASTTPAGLPRWGPRSALGSVMAASPSVIKLTYYPLALSTRRLRNWIDRLKVEIIAAPG
jgi:hypothetical protein